jgi:hypothetical protein
MNSQSMIQTCGSDLNQIHIRHVAIFHVICLFWENNEVQFSFMFNTGYINVGTNIKFSEQTVM